MDTAATAPFVPLVYGSIAFWTGKRVAPGSAEHTHRWMVYVRHAEDRSLAYAVSKVVFTLHPSFAVPIRELTEAPFFVAETGWGEFDIGITVHFRDPDAEPVSLAHKLKLYPSVGSMEPNKPVVDEHYDEAVWMTLPKDPAIAAALLAGPKSDAPTYPYQDYFGSFLGDDDIARVQAARQYIQDRKVELEERLLRAQVESQMEREQLRLLGAI